MTESVATDATETGALALRETREPVVDFLTGEVLDDLIRDIVAEGDGSDTVPAEYAALMADIADVKPLYEALKARMDTSKARLLELMSGSPVIEKFRGEGITVTRVEKAVPKMYDLTAARRFLEERNCLARYTTIDVGRVYKDFNGTCPGIDNEPTVYLMVKADKRQENV